MVRERIDSRAQTPIGRDLLIESILQRTADARSAVAFVHGIPGIGKSRVLAAAAERARARGDRVIELDAATIEPTDNGFFDALARERGGPIGSIDEAMISLLGDATPVLLTLDGYDVLRLLDSWMRTAFVPALPDNVSMLIGSRDAPASAWMGFPDWGGSFDAIALGPLDDANAVELLVAAGVPPASAPEINRLAQGHPLALTLAAEAFKTHPEIGIRDAAIQGVVDGLAGSLLAEEADPLVERALKAAAVTRRTTESLLQVQLPDTDANEAIRRLEALSFVERRWDGLVLHEAVRQAIATHLNMTDPATHRELRCAA